MRIGRNILAGLANSIFGALIGIAVVPLYLKYLGMEAYGLIGFFTATQALLALLDLGLAPTINREVARFSASGAMQQARTCLHTLAVVYGGVAVLIALLVYVLAPFMASHWLQSRDLDPESVKAAIMLMGLVIACRWPIGLYQGALMGMQRLTVSSGVSIVMTTISHAGAVGTLALVSPTIEAFFLWQVASAILYVAVMRQAAWRVLGREGIGPFDFNDLKRIWRFSAGMSGVAVSAVVLIQLDKILLSRILSLEDFGRYTLAVTVANGLYILLTPLFNVIYPRMSALVAASDSDALTRLYKQGAKLFLALFFPIAIAAAVFSQDLLYLWTGNQQLAKTSASIVSLILVGTTLNGVMHFPYALQLACGNTKLPLTINALLIMVTVPITILLALSYGAVGGALAWAILNGIYVVLGTWLTHRTLLKGEGAKWLMCDVLPPLIVALVITGAVGEWIRQSGYSHGVNLMIAGVLVSMAAALTVLTSPALRELARAGWVAKFR